MNRKKRRRRRNINHCPKHSLAVFPLEQITTTQEHVAGENDPTFPLLHHTRPSIHHRLRPPLAKATRQKPRHFSTPPKAVDFFFLKNHGIDYGSLFDVASEFFQMSLDEKEKYDNAVSHSRIQGFRDGLC